ncbi:hypothetical protein E4U16_006970 [Claviceps sp. LM84 group G4]|nr:hypothetical protein E4U33_007047 [Claviceps sp. LM78 group G4]KAG6070370.1 hypothetical protein E4U16_006970 [Claviceps sp. LM84 group G4]
MVSEDKSDSLQSNTRKFWTVEEHDLLLSLKKAGETWKDISERLGRTPGACQHQYNQRFEVFQTERLDGTPGACQLQYNQRFEDSQSSKGSLQTKLNKHWTEEEDKLLLTLKEAGGTWQEISESLGRTPAACRGHYFSKRLEISEKESSQGSSQLKNETEERRLFQLKASDETWPEIAQRLPVRTNIDCQRRYEEGLDAYDTERSQGSLQANLIKLKPWTEEEDKLLLKLKEAGGKWQEISESLGRTPGACRSRYGKYLEVKVSETEKSQSSLQLENERVKWTAEEEKLLVQLKASHKTWQEISERLGRTPRACQIRHGQRLEVSVTEKSQGSLQPRNERKKWTAEEEKLLFQLKVADKTWQEISDHLPGRTVNACQVHYNDVLHRGWGHEEVNKLARLYESRKAEMWDKIAKRLAIPWREVEALHWQLRSRKAKPAESVGEKSLSKVGADLSPPPVHDGDDAELQANEQQQDQSQQDNTEKTWSREELKSLMTCIKSNMTWEETSKCLAGRTADSCRIYCENLRKKASECSSEPQSELHRLYQRFKPEMWAKIGQELKLPWEEAEEMHWRLGAEGMAKRAGVANLITLAPREPERTTDERFANDSSSAMSQDELIACIAELLDETVSEPSNDLESSNKQHES